MKKTKVFYWIFNGLLAFLMLGSAIPNITMDPMSIKGMHDDLGYPLYFIPFIGVLKVLGVVTILVPVNARLKEWAYAGFMFDLLGATYSIFASGMPVANWAFMIVPIALLTLAYVFHHKKLKGAGARKASGAAVQPALAS